MLRGGIPGPAGNLSDARHVLSCLIPPAIAWLRTNGVNTNGAAAKVMIFDRLGKKVHPGTFGKIKVGYREYPKGPSVKTHEICSDPISADSISPFPNTSHLDGKCNIIQ